MASVLADYLRERAAEDAGKAQANRAVIDEWTRAVETLLGQVMGWLRDADPDGEQLRPSLSRRSVADPTLGRYEVQTLELSPPFGSQVRLLPRGRYTLGGVSPDPSSPPERAAGQVDLTDGISRHALLRWSRPGQPDRWFLEDYRGVQQPLTRESFEAALLGYLR